MAVEQWFETVITDLDGSGASYRFVYAPFLERLEDEDVPTVQVAASELSLTYLQPIASATTLPQALLRVLNGAVQETDANGAPVGLWPDDSIDLELTRFIEHLSYSPVIPVELSPLDLHSLGEVLTKGSGVAVGAWAGVVASGGTPLILLTVPAGMIIGGAAAGVGHALEEGLRERITGWIRTKRKRPKRTVLLIRLKGSQDQNSGFLDRLKAIRGVEKQTRFITEGSGDDNRSVVKLWTKEPISESQLNEIAAATQSEIESVVQDT
jgi:hypothetical protein